MLRVGVGVGRPGLGKSAGLGFGAHHVWAWAVFWLGYKKGLVTLPCSVHYPEFLTMACGGGFFRLRVIFH
jgi:hypothetical protein